MELAGKLTSRAVSTTSSLSKKVIEQAETSNFQQTKSFFAEPNEEAAPLLRGQQSRSKQLQANCSGNFRRARMPAQFKFFRGGRVPLCNLESCHCTHIASPGWRGHTLTLDLAEQWSRTQGSAVVTGEAGGSHPLLKD